MLKKGIALWLALCIICSMVPLVAAEESPENSAVPVSVLAEETASTEAVQTECTESEAPADEDAFEAPVLRAAATYTTSTDGKIFIAKMHGSNVSSAILAPYEQIVNTFIRTFDVALNQNQFDALVDLAYDCPGAFTNNLSNRDDKNRFELCIIDGNYTDAEFADALCGFVRSGGYISETMVNRRVREARLFLHGDYTGTDPDSETFYSVIFYPNGGTAPRSACCFAKGEAYGTLPIATKDGKSFTGWYSDIRGGSHISHSVIVCSNIIVYARWGTSPVSDPNAKSSSDPASGRSDGVSIMKNRSSDALIEFIQGHEGFVHYAVWDYAQYSIGYGSCVSKDDYPNGIHEREADRLMRWMLYDTFEASVTTFVSKNALTLKQNEYDALVSFSYNVGTSWISDSRLADWLKKRTTNMELVNAMGAWCNAGGEILAGLVYRRMDEAQMFLYGDYKRDSGGNLYQAINFRANGGTLAPNGKIVYYAMGNPYGSFPGVYYDSHVLTGWTDANGRVYSPSQTAAGDKLIKLTAQWKDSEPVVDPNPPSPPDPPGPTPGPVPTFSDVKPSDWYYDAVSNVCSYGLFSGSGDGTFSPKTTMTRAMLVSVLYRLSGAKVSYEPLFSDVSSDKWYAQAVVWAYKNNIVNGIGDSRFAPENSITREQIAVILYNYAKKSGRDVSAQGDLFSFPDVNNISTWARAAVSWAVAKGLISGTTINNRTMIAPAKTASRAEVASMLWRFMLACGMVKQ